ncbi:MAG: hypothetical protein V4507_02745 [Verrucomicrobiota bacterium]
MKNFIKLLVPVIAIAFIGCASTSEEKSCCSSKTTKRKTVVDDSKEVHKVQY